MQMTSFWAKFLATTATTAAGLQRQLDALACFCEQRQLTVNLAKTKVVVFEAHGTACTDFVFNGKVVIAGVWLHALSSHSDHHPLLQSFIPSPQSLCLECSHGVAS